MIGLVCGGGGGGGGWGGVGGCVCWGVEVRHDQSVWSNLRSGRAVRGGRVIKNSQLGLNLTLKPLVYT